MSPEGAYVIHVPADKVCSWKMDIRLLEGSVTLLELIAGSVTDHKFCHNEEYLVPSDPWGWFIDFGRTVEGEKSVSFWFRDRLHAIYFKLLWTGKA